MLFAECENGKEVSGKRTEQELYHLGYKPACNNLGGGEWVEYRTCWVQEKKQEEEPSDVE